MNRERYPSYAAPYIILCKLALIFSSGENKDNRIRLFGSEEGKKGPPIFSVLTILARAIKGSIFENKLESNRKRYCRYESW